ncbi:MAG: hypothetical protein HQ528_05915 [Candidatus Marinimicrobia bacterium]|nr:hypothetical protein [Candidatus Neomarinimicrobiota bacterium]
MNKKIIVVIITILVLTTFISAKSQNTSFKVGLPFSTVQILLGENNESEQTLTPTFALSYFTVGSKYKRTEDGSTSESDISAHFIIPRVGARILSVRNEELRSYYIGEIFYVLPFITGSDITDETKEEFNDATNLLGITVGWGVEYFFSKSFSVGGEATFSMLFHSTTYESEDEYDEYSYKREYKTRVGATMTQITFNYYFN